MPTVNIHEAKPHLSKLVDQAHTGQKIVIARTGKSVARLIPAGKQQTCRLFGAPAGFDAFLPEDLIQAFEGRF
jgi:prevent-host-death family protein